MHLELGSPRLAETTLRAAIRLDPNNHTSWYNLGLVMEVMLIWWWNMYENGAANICQYSDSGQRE